MSAALLATIAAACAGTLILLHAVLRCKESSECLLDEYGKLLAKAREKTLETTEAAEKEADEDPGEDTPAES